MINYELFAKQVQKKALELVKQRNLPVNAIGVGIDEDPEQGPVFLLALDMDNVEQGVIPFLLYKVIEKGVDGFAEDIADVVQQLAGKGNELSFPYHVAYDLPDLQVSNMVGCQTPKQAKEIAEIIFEGYKKISSKVTVRVIDDITGTVELVFK